MSKLLSCNTTFWLYLFFTAERFWIIFCLCFSATKSLKRYFCLYNTNNKPMESRLRSYTTFEVNSFFTNLIKLIKTEMSRKRNIKFVARQKIFPSQNVCFFYLLNDTTEMQ